MNFIKVDVCTSYHRAGTYVSQAIAKNSSEVKRGDPTGEYNM